MGDIKRKPNLFSRPRKIFDSARIAEEDVIKRKYGLKNKREIWRASAKISILRTRAKKLIPKSEDEKAEFFERLQKQGLDVKDISDVLALKTENWLDRRLQTIVFKKGFATSTLQARQLITHKNVLVNERIVNIPSFVVTKNLENKISLKARKLKPTKEIKEETQ
jgi:small subunit ribosomal protein S4